MAAANTPTKALEPIVRHLLEQTATPAPALLGFQSVRSSPRSAVLRLEFGGLWCGQKRLVAKQAVGDGAAERFGRELVALRLLSELNLDPPVAPKLLAWDNAARLFLLEDLGDRSLAKVLFEKERAAAHAALVGYAAALGRLHAGTAGKEPRAIAIRRELAMNSEDCGNPRNLSRDRMHFGQLCDMTGVAIDAAFDDDVQQVETTLAAPGPFRALTHGDPCPDNERLTAGSVMFFDFETGGYDHALLDAAYLVMAFPTCWCAGNLPIEVLAEGQTIYRQMLAKGIPEASDETTFARHLLHASARWLLTGDTLVPRAQRDGSNRLVGLLAADWTWGCSTARQRLLHRLGAFIQLAQGIGGLPGLTATAARVHRALASRWPSDTHRLANYPAFVGG